MMIVTVIVVCLRRVTHRTAFLRSPWTGRGPISIDPETRDVVQTVYVRKVETVNGKLYNVEFDKFTDQKDPGK